MHIFVLSVHRANKLFFLFLSLTFALACARMFPFCEEYYYERSIPVSSGYEIEPNTVLNAGSYPVSRTGWFVKIDLDALTLSVYREGGLRETFPVSGGTAEWPSPSGVWRITAKSGWGEGFGGSWMSLNVPWGRYGIHGTLHPWLIGRKNGSHGCIRMKSGDAEKLRKLVPVGTTVLIIQENAPFRTLSSGKFGSDVFKLQVSLGSLGLYGGPMDGRFGESTKKSVLAFQRGHGFHPTGIADYSTYFAALSLASD